MAGTNGDISWDVQIVCVGELTKTKNTNGGGSI